MAPLPIRVNVIQSKVQTPGSALQIKVFWGVYIVEKLSWECDENQNIYVFLKYLDNLPETSYFRISTLFVEIIC